MKFVEELRQGRHKGQASPAREKNTEQENRVNLIETKKIRNSIPRYIDRL